MVRVSEDGGDEKIMALRKAVGAVALRLSAGQT